jgi:A/G-specific adenine glycosylase
VRERPSAEDPDWAAGVRDALLRHFDAHARPLPWRRTADPYNVLVSEVMLQQTRVAAVVPYYERWMRRFPDIATLADAPLDDVLKAWEGLGYYSRARNLHRAAHIMRERHAGTVPADYTALRALPGIGDYTAGAVASIAYGMRRPAIDGNARRVGARLLDDPAPTPARLRALADALVADDRPGDVNQALMDVGATICTPRAPRCGACPLAQFCAARATGTQLERPRRRRGGTTPLFNLATAVIRAPDGSVLLTRRPATGLLARMWCLPASEVREPEDAPAAAVDVARSLIGAVPLDHAVELGAIEHAFSHRRERYLCWQIDVAHRSVEPNADITWIGVDLSGCALPAAQRRILGLAQCAFHSTERSL